MLIGIGSSDDPRSVAAGTECGRRAMASVSGGAGLALAFCGGQHDPEAFLKGLRHTVGHIPVIGGSAVGAMTSSLFGASGTECAVAVFSDRLPETRFARVGNLGAGERAAGRELAVGLLPHIGPESTILLFYDSVASAQPPRLHVGSRLMNGLYDVLDAEFPERTPLLVGAGMLRDIGLTSGYVFDGDRAAKHAAVAAVMPHTLVPDTAIMHGCRPASDFLEITRIDGADVYELDGRPAVEVLAERLSLEPAALATQRVSLALTLGERHGNPDAEFDERNYVNRLVMNTHPSTGVITLFEADFHVGTRVQLMVTDTGRMCRSTIRQTEELLARNHGADTALALYIDCAGRSSVFNGSPEDEAGIVRERLGSSVPWLGLYSGVEIAPLLGRSRPLDWTGVLTLFRQGRGARPAPRDPGSEFTAR